MFNFTKKPFLKHDSPFTYKMLRTLYEIDAQWTGLLLLLHYMYLHSIMALTIPFLFFFFLSFFSCSLLCQDRVRCGTPSWKNANQHKSHLAVLSSQPPKAFYCSWNEVQVRPYTTWPLTTTQLTSHHSAVSPARHTPPTQASTVSSGREEHLSLRASAVTVPSASPLCSLPQVCPCLLFREDFP